MSSSSGDRGSCWSRWTAAACLVTLLIGVTFTSRMTAQANEPTGSGAQQASPSIPPPASQPAEPAASAQSPGTASPQKPKPRAPRPTRKPGALLDDRVKAFAASLDLNQAQQAAVKRILVDRENEILRLRKDGSISGADRIGRLHLLQDQTVEKIRSVLNDEQKKKYDPLAVRKVPPAPDQKSLEDWLKVTTPHTTPQKQ